MFLVGKNYEFRMLEAGGEVLFQGVIDSYEHPLIKLKDRPKININYCTGSESRVTTVGGAPGEIINITSPSFISAVEKPI